MDFNPLVTAPVKILPRGTKIFQIRMQTLISSVAQLEMPVLNVQEHRQKQAVLSLFFA